MVQSTQRSVVVMATSSPPDHPPESVLDDRGDTFWLSTGMLPQCLMFEMNENCSVKSVSLESDGVRALSVFGSADPDFNKFLKLGTYETSRNESRMTVKLEKGNIVKFLQINFEKSSEPFIAVFSVKFEV